MSGLFLKLLNMSISASVLIVVVVLARRLLLRNCDTLKIIFCKIPVCRVV